MKRRCTPETSPWKAWFLLLAVPGCVSPEPAIETGGPAMGKDASEAATPTGLSRLDAGAVRGRDPVPPHEPDVVDASPPETAETGSDPQELPILPGAEPLPPWERAVDEPESPLTWPPYEELNATLDELDGSDCRVTRYAEDGVTVQARWGYEYGPDGQLLRELRFRSDIGIEVLVYDEFARLVAHCTEDECRHLQYRDTIGLRIDGCGGAPPCQGVEVGTGREVLLTRHSNPPALEETELPAADSNRWDHVLPEGAILWQFDDESELVQITSHEGRHGVRYCYEGGGLSKVTRDDILCSDSQHWDFHSNGHLARYRSVIDEPEANDAIYECSAEGWQLLNEFSGGCISCALSYEGREPTVPDGIVADVAFGCYQGQLSGPVSWDSEGNSGIWTASDSTLGTTREWTVDRRRGRDDRNYDERGNVVRREWRHEGAGEVRVETYEYEGTGPCRDGHNVHLEFVWELPQHRLLTECPAKPITSELRLSYEAGVTCEPVDEPEP